MNTFMTHSVPDAFDMDLTTPTPRASHFPPLTIPQSYANYYQQLDPAASPDASTSPYSSPSPKTDYSTNTSLSLSPSSTHSSLPTDAEDCAPGEFNFTSPMSSKSPLKPSSNPRANPPPRKGDPSYIPRPENAFILFRKDAVLKIRAVQAAEAATQLPSLPAATGAGKGEKGKRQRQADMSKTISHMWKNLSTDERAVWEEKAASAKREHEARHPDYRYQPSRPHAKSASKSRGLSRKRSELDDSDDHAGGFSETFVVRATRSARRSSTCSNASSVSSTSSHVPPAIALPSLHVATRPGSPYPPVSYTRSRSGSRQWVQPPAEDPSPPPSELYFPRTSPKSSLENYFGGVADLEPSPMIQESVSVRRPKPTSPAANAPHASSSSEKATIFVEPITSDRNPWSPTGPSKMPSTPRRASNKGSRSRSYSLPHPLRLTQSSAPSNEDVLPEYEVASLDLGWSPQSLPGNSPLSEIDVDCSWYSSNQGSPPSLSSPESDCPSDFGYLDMPALDMDLDRLLQGFGDVTMYNGDGFQSQSPEDALEAAFRPVNLDMDGRPFSF